MSEARNLAEALPEEIRRCLELVEVYRKIGPIGEFGRKMIQSYIDAAIKASAEHDTVGMLRAYNELKECQ